LNSELLEHTFIKVENASHGREKLLEVIHQSFEIKKRKKTKNNSGRRASDFPSKKSSDSDSSDDKTVKRPDGTIIHSQRGNQSNSTGRSLQDSFSSMIVTENNQTNRDNQFSDFINEQK